MPMVKCAGAPDAGNLHVRCDEGGERAQARPLYSTVLVVPSLTGDLGIATDAGTDAGADADADVGGATPWWVRGGRGGARW